jgi:LysM repeat protein
MRLGAGAVRLFLLGAMLAAEGVGLAQVTSTSVGLRRDVKRLATNDAVQDQRIATLEQDVSQLQQKYRYTPSPPSAKTAAAVLPSAAVRQPTERPATVYTVKPGDTLWRIAMNHKVSIGDVKSANGMKNDVVMEGQKLKIPGRSAPPPPVTKAVVSGLAQREEAVVAAVQSAAAGTHTVAKGETISRIAQQYGVSQAALLQANPGVNPNVMAIGTRLRLPPAPKSAVPAAAASQVVSAAPKPPPPPVAGEGMGRHVVVAGDTLMSLSRRYGVGVDQLMAANRLSNPNLLRVGQTLQIPQAAGVGGGGAGAAAAGRTEEKPVVEKAVRPAAQATVSEVGRNQVAALAPGYPAAAGAATAAVSAGPQPLENHRGVLMYRVHPTDTLETIASTFGTTPDRLRQLNGLAPNEGVSVNDDIVVPAAAAVNSGR